MNQENKQLPMASDYIETVYGTKNFARSIAVQDAPSLMGLMEDFADHCNKTLHEELEKLREENERLKYNHEETLKQALKAVSTLEIGVKALTEQNQKLREALEDIASDRGDYLEIAKEALKGVGDEDR